MRNGRLRLWSLRTVRDVLCVAVSVRLLRGSSGFSAPTASTSTSKPHVVVVGGGWAGFSVAHELVKNDNAHVTLLDASPNPGGLAGVVRTADNQRTVETGLHGFWREYRNTFDIMKDFVDPENVLTPYLPSVLYSSSGRVALAPVLADGATQPDVSNVLQALASNPTLSTVAKLLPPPLDIALASEFSNQSPLTELDRLSALALLRDWAAFDPSDPRSWTKYDGRSAESVFRTAGISNTLYNELVSPLLHVLPMCPGYDCSAAAALSCFHVFALQSRGAFDVRWCRGSITEKIFQPWAEQLKIDFRYGAFVNSIVQTEKGYQVTYNKDSVSIDCDAVVLAVGMGAAQKLSEVCPVLSKYQQSWNRLKGGVTCVCCRLFLNSGIGDSMEDSPVAVCGPKILPELVETGFCIYDLSRLQEVFASENALEVDFFRADRICELSDKEIGDVAVRAIETVLQVSIDVDEISVVRARRAVSHFHVGSAQHCPGFRLQKGLYTCGDWIDRSGYSAWSTEKSVVTGKQAAVALARDFGLSTRTTILPPPSDTPPLGALRTMSKLLPPSMAELGQF